MLAEIGGRAAAIHSYPSCPHLSPLSYSSPCLLSPVAKRLPSNPSERDLWESALIQTLWAACTILLWMAADDVDAVDDGRWQWRYLKFCWVCHEAIGLHQ